MHEIILHHYPASPFSEKVRLSLGLKRLAWRAVEQPNIMPKPELLPLTGGYRKIPVMQIGADVYCDSQCIVRELERRHPTPTLHPGGSEATSYAFAFWSDRVFFQAAVGVIFGQMADQVPKEFIEDRSKLLGTGQRFDTSAMKNAVPMLKESLRAQLSWLDAQLADGRAFLLGAAPGLADFTTYHSIWFLSSYYPPAAEILAPHARVRAWTERVRAIGHGSMKPMERAEALAIARAAQPETTPAADPGEPNGWKPGDRVLVMPDDYGRDPVAGELVRSSANEIAIRRSAPEVGEVVVHFPRAGFLVLRGG
ncbi:MAG TPA: glutathione S-transferase family protein [Myxococcota bacterium]|nr:glutathione S-transferase family protein [Myxococcota bacterium]